MCAICIEWEKKRMTSQEAFRAIGEMLYTAQDKDQAQHLSDLSERILSSEVPMPETNEELEQAWHKHIFEDE